MFSVLTVEEPLSCVLSQGVEANGKFLSEQVALTENDSINHLYSAREFPQLVLFRELRMREFYIPAPEACVNR
jgi:hypothetical protein